MADNPRIEELRRRVQKDPASIAFAQLAEEYRRAGRFQDAIDTCRTGLAQHPGYVSAHVTLGRACIETGDLKTAEKELTGVLTAAPENLAALRGLAEIHHRRKDLPQALGFYRRALELARHDPDLEHLVAQIARELHPTRPPPAVPDGLSFDEAMGEFLAFSARETAASPAAPAVDPDGTGPIPVLPQTIIETSAAVPVPSQAGRGLVDDDETTRLDDVTARMSTPPPVSASAPVPPVSVPLQPPAEPALQVAPDASPPPAAALAPAPAPVPDGDLGAVSEGRAALQIRELERWLDAIRSTRASNA